MTPVETPNVEQASVMKFKPSEAGAKKLAAVNNRAPKGKNPLKSDLTPDEVVSHFVARVLQNVGSGIDANANPVDEFINIIDRLWGSDGEDSREPEEVSRCIATNFLYNTPKNFKGPRKIRTNIPLWIIKSIVRSDADPFTFKDATFTWADVTSSVKFQKTLNDLTRAIGAHPVKVFGSNDGDDSNTVDVSRFRDGDLEEVFAKGETPDGSRILVFEFKRRIPQKDIDNWVKNNLAGKPAARKSNKDKYNKILRKGNRESEKIVKQGRAEAKDQVRKIRNQIVSVNNENFPSKVNEDSHEIVETVVVSESSGVQE